LPPLISVVLGVRLVCCGIGFLLVLLKVRTNSSHGRHFGLKLCVGFEMMLRSFYETKFKHVFRIQLSQTECNGSLVEYLGS
jgi:hypothetical protein